MRIWPKTYGITAALAGTAMFIAPAAIASPGVAVESPTAAGQGSSEYFTGDYTPSLELYSFNNNLIEWIKNREGAPPITTPEAIDWAAQAGFHAVDITAYYIPGYEGAAMPSLPTAQIMQYGRDIKAQCQRLGLKISGTGVGNDFATSDAAARALDVQRVKFWTDFAAEMGAPYIRVFSGARPSDIHQLAWETVALTRVVPALKEVTAYAATKGVKVLLQNHGDMTATAGQTIQILNWVNNPNLGLIDDTGYFRPFGADTGADYDWYGDIAKLLPYSDSSYVKLQPAGAGTNPPMDFSRLFTDMRLSPYRGYIPLERLWAKDAPDNPKNQPTPPYDEVLQFYQQVKDALAQTKTSPFTAIEQLIDSSARSGQVSDPVRAQLANRLSQAHQHFAAGQDEQAMRSMQDFLDQLQDPAASVSEDVRQALSQKMAALLQSFHDVFGWPVSLTDTVPTTMQAGSTASFTTTLTNRSGSVIPSARMDFTVLPVNPTPSRSHPSGEQPVALSPGDVTLQYRTASGNGGLVDVALSPGPDGSLTGHLGSLDGSSIKLGVTRDDFSIAVNHVPAGYIRVDLSLDQVDSTGTITTPGIATISTGLDVTESSAAPIDD